MTIVIILLIPAVLLVVLAIVISTRPDEFRVTRSVEIATPATAPFARVNNLHNWRAWSPFEDLDPDVKRTYDGAEEGIGARYTWSGNSKAGEGIMTIIESRPADVIKMDLEFLRPFKARNAVEFTFQPRGGQTVVSWSMSGRDTFVMKAFGLVCNRDKMCGCLFEKGLNQMKAVCESAA